MVKRFNEREIQLYGKKAVLRKFLRLADKGKSQKVHNWHKIFFGQQDNCGRIYDVWECKRCGLQKRVYGLGHPPYGEECFPERTCRECNKVFKSIENYKRHLKRIHGKE